MRIAIIAHLKYPIREPFFGGLEMHTYLLTKRLIERGHRVTLYAAPESDPDLNPRFPADLKPQMGLADDLFKDYPDYSELFVKRLHDYSFILRDIVSKEYDLVHNNCLHFLPLAQVHTIPAPVVTTLHTPPFSSLQAGVALARLATNHHFVAVSHHLAEVWKPFVGRVAEVVHNGIDLDTWAGETYPAYLRTAVWTGRICPEKGLEYAIDAAAQAGFKLVIAGAIYDSDYYLEKIVPRLGERAVYLGHLNHAELRPIISMSQCGLFTSTWDEPFGLVITEMLACGTPVVAFDSGAASEIIATSVGKIVPKGDVNAMALAMPKTTGINRWTCRAYVRKRFSCQRMVDHYEAFYKRVVEQAVIKPLKAGHVTDGETDSLTSVA